MLDVVFGTLFELHIKILRFKAQKTGPVAWSNQESCHIVKIPKKICDFLSITLNFIKDLCSILGAAAD